MLIKYNEQDHKEEVEQYFFVDSRNRIQILWPNYDLKVERVKTIELISKQAGILQKNCDQFKKINYISEKTITFHEQRNIVQNMDHLKKILNFNNVSLAN